MPPLGLVFERFFGRIECGVREDDHLHVIARALGTFRARQFSPAGQALGRGEAGEREPEQRGGA